MRCVWFFMAEGDCKVLIHFPNELPLKIGLPFYRPILNAAFKWIPQPFIQINSGSESDPAYWLSFRKHWRCSRSPVVEPWEPMGLSKWLINPHTGIFLFRLNLFTLQNKFSLGEMGQIDKPCVTDNCSVIPTERVTCGRFSYVGETCPVTQETTIFIFIFFKYKDTVVLVSSLNGFSSIPVPPSSTLGTHVCAQSEIKANNTQKTGLGHYTRRFPSVPWKKEGRDSDTLECVDAFLGGQTAPHKG